MIQHICKFLAVGTTLIVLSACGEDDSGSSSASGVRSGIAVDPYIRGATFCIDENASGGCDDGEALSSQSTTVGQFDFAAAVPAGSLVVMQDLGTHVAFANTVRLKAVVPIDAQLSVLVTPITTMLADGWTEAEILSAFAAADLAEVTVEHFSIDPMQALEDGTAASISDESFVAVRATMAAHALLRLAAVSGDGSPLSAAAFNANGTLQAQFAQIVGIIKPGMTKAKVEGIDTTLLTATEKCARFGLEAAPPATAGIIVRSTLGVVEHVLPQMIADSAFVPDTEVLNPLSSEMGRRYYAQRNSGDACIANGIRFGSLPSPEGCAGFGIDDAAAEVLCIP